MSKLKNVIASISPCLLGKRSIFKQIVKAIPEVMILVDNKKRIVDIVFDGSKEPVRLCTDANRLVQVVTNLMSNAIKFTNEGSITLGYRNTPKGVFFYVQDSGIGIVKENLTEVFDRFTEINSKTYRLGLGLPISRAIVEHLSGEIGVESELGKGSKFWFSIPHKDQHKSILA